MGSGGSVSPLGPSSWLSGGIALSRCPEQGVGSCPVAGSELLPFCAPVSATRANPESPPLSGLGKPAWKEAPLQSQPAGPCWDRQGREGWQRPWHQCNVHLVIKLRNSSPDLSLGEIDKAFASQWNASGLVDHRRREPKQPQYSPGAGSGVWPSSFTSPTPVQVSW